MLTKIILTGIILIVAIGLYSCTSNRAVNKEKSDNYYFNFFKTEVHYIPMGNSFELGNDKLESVDIKTVQILGSNYLKDKSQVYFKSMKIKNAEANSFEIVCANKGSFAKDKNRVYYQGNSFEELDLASFTFVGDSCGSTLKDKHHVYSIYAVQSFGEANQIIPFIPSANPETYQDLNDLYGKDDSMVYYKGKSIAHSDVNTFTLVRDYAKDKYMVYYGGLEVKGLDPETFMFVEDSGYTRDKNDVYYGLDVVADKDDHPLYYTAKVVAGADPETFKMIKGEKIDYAKDKANYYWGGVKQ